MPRNVRDFTDSKHVAAHILAKIANFLHKIVLKNCAQSNLVVKAAKITQANFFWNKKSLSAYILFPDPGRGNIYSGRIRRRPV